MRTKILVLFALLFTAPAFAQNDRRALVRQCVSETTSRLQAESSREVIGSGGVTCPQGDIVGFPPRTRKHDRSGRIAVSAGAGRVICPGSMPEVRNVSDNGGSRGNFEFDALRENVSIAVSCRGSGPGGGRRWFNADLVAQSCVRITEDMILDATLNCAQSVGNQ